MLWPPVRTRTCSVCVCALLPPVLSSPAHAESAIRNASDAAQKQAQRVKGSEFRSLQAATFGSWARPQLISWILSRKSRVCSDEIETLSNKTEMQYGVHPVAFQCQERIYRLSLCCQSHCPCWTPSCEWFIRAYCLFLLIYKPSITSLFLLCLSSQVNLIYKVLLTTCIVTKQLYTIHKVQLCKILAVKIIL